MVFQTWQEAAAYLHSWLSGPTSKQLELARIAGADITSNTPQPVAAVRLRISLSDVIGTSKGYSPNPAQVEFITRLAEEEGEAPPPSCATSEEAEAWVQYFYGKRRLAAIEKLRVTKGDIVRLDSDPEAAEEVSSIGKDGTLYLKGRRRVWPDLVEVVARKDEPTNKAEDFRRQAANRAATRAARREPSMAMLSELAQFQAREAPSESELSELSNIIENAKDEKPIQRYLEGHPNIIASLFRGPMRFAISHQRLGAEFVPDLLVAEVDSGGIRWMLIELENPNSDVALSRGNDFDRFARKGISQINEWREWLQDNLDYASRSRRKNGLGLTDIRPQAEGLVLVGRRFRLSPKAAKLRKSQLERNNIQVHTYDWLLEHLTGAAEFSGPSGQNPFLLHPSTVADP